jgi:hypothetical protein
MKCAKAELFSLPMSLSPRHRERATAHANHRPALKASRNMRRKTMKTMFLAAAAALSLGVGSAYANEGGPVANTFFTELPGYIAQPPAQTVPSVATAQSGQTHVYATGSQSKGTWLFPPNQNGGGGNS